MAEYKFSLTNYGGCYIGIEASTLKKACDVYQLIARSLHRSNNSVVDTVTRIRSEVLFCNEADKT